jgi:hypothetical protein
MIDIFVLPSKFQEPRQHIRFQKPGTSPKVTVAAVTIGPSAEKRGDGSCLEDLNRGFTYEPESSPTRTQPLAPSRHHLYGPPPKKAQTVNSS